MKRLYLSFLFIISAVILVHAGAAGECAAAENNGPIHIEADRMESDQNKSAVHFAGNVVAKQGDLVIKSDDMQVFYKENGEQTAAPPAEAKGIAPAGAQKIHKLFATGNVEITSQGSVATGDEMEYHAQERKVVLTGNSKVWQNNNMVSGDRIVFFLDEGKSIVERNGKTGERVKAYFYPDSEQQQ